MSVKTWDVGQTVDLDDYRRIKAENAALKQRMKEMEAERVSAVFTYRSHGRSGVCGATMGANGAGEFAIVYCGVPHDESDTHARELVRSLESAGYRLSEYRYVADIETYSGSPIRVIKSDELAEVKE